MAADHMSENAPFQLNVSQTGIENEDYYRL